MIEFFNFC